MKKSTALLCLFFIIIGSLYSVEAKVKDDSRIVKKIWENKVRYYQFIDNKYLITREGSMDYHVYELNHLSGQLDKIMEIEDIGFRVNFAVDDHQIYIVYQIRDYPQIEQVIECRNLLTGEIIWSQTIEPVTTINISNGCLYIAKEKLIFLQMGLEENKYDLVFFDKNRGNILSEIKLDGYNYYVKPLIFEDELIIATTNDGLISHGSTSWLTRIDLNKLKVVNKIELKGIISGTYIEDERVFWKDGMFFAGVIIPGKGRALLKIQDDFSFYKKIDCKVSATSFWKYNDYYIVSGMNGIAKLTKDQEIEYLEYEKYVPYSSYLVKEDYLVYWPMMNLLDLRTNDTTELLDIAAALHWYYEKDGIMVLLIMEADSQGRKRDYYLQGYCLSL